MKRKSFKDVDCPIAQTLERVGEQWTILILRDALRGKRRFDEFQTSLDIAPAMLTKRLSALVEARLMERSRYCEKPARYEYLLTEAGREFQSVIQALIAYGNAHYSAGKPAVNFVDTETGRPVDPIMVDRLTLEPLRAPRFRLVDRDKP
ncbi:winged helix-turn-helix transcriptional regulator [Rhizobium rhizogenes]|uniref:winged helix-turn-helix transcriptional regulator n=1 Tax=Rhizobium rhizogenes TaxID=359 RepID=UPI001571E163|nr:helix-turn-helix domain-containing protein [Rhizobium rhizogenes]NTF98281.1 helix-turn-helix transcriptional regulator [Rhizobium rhizogenes]